MDASGRFVCVGNACFVVSNLNEDSPSGYVKGTWLHFIRAYRGFFTAFFFLEKNEFLDLYFMLVLYYIFNFS